MPPIEENTESTETTTTTAQISFLKETKDAVNASVKNVDVRQQVVQILADKKKAARVDTLIKAIDALGKNVSELNKIQPKPTGVDETGKPLPKVYSTEDYKKRTELQQKTAKLDATVRKALEETAGDAEWKSLDELVSKNG